MHRARECAGTELLTRDRGDRRRLPLGQGSRVRSPDVLEAIIKVLGLAPAVRRGDVAQAPCGAVHAICPSGDSRRVEAACCYAGGFRGGVVGCAGELGADLTGVGVLQVVEDGQRLLPGLPG